MNHRKKSKYEKLGVNESFFIPKHGDNIGKPEWSSPETFEDFEKIASLSGMRLYDFIKEFEIRKHEKLPLVFRSPKREVKKCKTIFEIVKNLPCTLSVLSRKTKLSKTLLRRYLNNLIDAEVVRKEFDKRCEMDIYYLNDEFRRVDGDKKLIGLGLIWYHWIDKLPEYQLPSVSNPKPKGLAVKLLIRGQKNKPINASRAVEQKIKRFRKSLWDKA